MRAGGLELLDDGEEMGDRAGQAIKPDHDQGFARADSRAAGAPAPAGSGLRRRRAPQARWRSRRRAARRAADRCPVPRWRPVRIANQTAWQGGLRQFSRQEFRALGTGVFTNQGRTPRQPRAERRCSGRAGAWGQRYASLAPSDEATPDAWPGMPSADFSYHALVRLAQIRVGGENCFT